MVLEIISDLSENLCYPEELRDKIKIYSIDNLSAALFPVLEKLFHKLELKGDAERFLKDFYPSVVLKSDLYFREIRKPSSTLISKKLGDKLLALYRKPPAGPSLQPLAVSEREMGGLQYISGYVVGKILKKTRNHKNYKSIECQSIIAVLNNMMASNCEDQRLIQALTRGGLKSVKPEVQTIFKLVEERFRVETSGFVTQIDTKNILSKLLKNSDLRSLYNGVVGNRFGTCQKEVKENLLEKMISLYLRVRAFSTAKDIILKHRDTQKKQKSKGLRKSLKKAESSDDVV